MALKRLIYEEIRLVNAGGRLPPLMEPTQASSEILTCPVCLEFKIDKMLIHLNCMRILCSNCVLVLIDQQKDCPLCRGQVNELLEATFFIKPPPIIQQFIDNVDYECSACLSTMKIGPAKEHHKTCSREPPRHQPPSYIPPRGLEPLERRELVSNPITQRASFESSRLIIYHHNGSQICSKMIPGMKTVRDLKQQVSDITGADMEGLKMFKFYHKELNDWEKVGHVAANDGANYLSTFTNFQELSTRTANIILQELGPPPRVEKPPEVIAWTGEPIPEDENQDDSDQPAWVRFWLNR